MTAPNPAYNSLDPRPGVTPTIDPFATPATLGRTTEHAGYPLPAKDLREWNPQMDRFGRYLLPNPVTGKVEGHTRVTTGAGTLDETSGLERWKMRNVVKGIHTDPTLLDTIDFYGEPREISRDLDKVAEKAQVLAGSADAAELGTALHAWLEAIDGGLITVEEIPEVFRPKVDAYLAALARHGMTAVPEFIERLVYNAQTGWVGRLDRVYRLADDTLVIGDVKTAKDMRYSWLKVAVQLATYAGASHVMNLDGTAWIPVEEAGLNVGGDDAPFAVVAHVPSNGSTCTMETVDLAAGREALATADHVRRMRTEAPKVIPGVWKLPEPKLVELIGEETIDPALTIHDTHLDGIRAQIAEATDQDELAAIWSRFQHVWTDHLTELGRVRLAEVEASKPRETVNPFRP